MRKILLWGGSFNPIHKSHADVARQLTNICDQVWIMPAYKSLWGKELVDYKHRLNMCRLATQYDPNVEVSDWEGRNVDLADKGTVVLMQKLKSDYHNFDIHLVIGSDNAIKIDKWKNYKELLQNNDILVVPRVGHKMKPEDYDRLRGYNVRYASGIHVEEMASSDVRKSVYENKKYIDDRVWDYMSQYNLYGIGHICV